MDELRKNLRELEKLCHRYDSICGLVYILKDSLIQNEDILTSQYSMGALYISTIMTDFQEEFQTLLDKLFSSLRTIKNGNEDTLSNEKPP